MRQPRTSTSDATRNPIAPLPDYETRGREDRYVDAYFGREYEAPPGTWPEGPTEVIIRSYQMVLRQSPHLGGIRELLDKDPELLAFALGVLFRFEPPE